MGHQKNSHVQTLNQCVTIDAVVLHLLQQDIMGSKTFPGLLDQIPTQSLTDCVIILFYLKKNFFLIWSWYLWWSFYSLFIYLFTYLWLCWVFVSAWGLSLVVASGGHSSSRCTGLSLSRPLLLRSTGSRRAGSVIVAHRPSCSAACGIFPDQGSNPCALHWQADSQPLRHQGSPVLLF